MIKTNKMMIMIYMGGQQKPTKIVILIIKIIFYKNLEQQIGQAIGINLNP